MCSTYTEVYIYMHIYKYLYMCDNSILNLSLSLSFSLYVCTYVHLYICVYTCIYIYISVSYMWKHMHSIAVYICPYLCISIDHHHHPSGERGHGMRGASGSFCSRNLSELDERILNISIYICIQLHIYIYI